MNQGTEPLTRAGEPHIREYMVQRGESTGQIRNLAFEYITTPYAMNWDDDDWHGSERVMTQLTLLGQTGLPNTLTRLMLTDWASQETRVTESLEYSYVGTLLYPVTSLRYPELTGHEDNAFYKEQGEVMHIDNPANLYFRIFHGSNSMSRKHVFEVSGKQNRELTMREKWYADAIKTMYRIATPVNVATVEDVEERLRGCPFMKLNRAQWIEDQAIARGLRTALELGTCHGSGAAFMSRIFEHVTTVDIGYTRTPNVWDMIRGLQLHNVTPRVRQLGANAIPGGMYDFIYIDGGHTYQNCKADLHTAIDHINPGGLIVLDDLDHPTYTGPARVFKEYTGTKTVWSGWGVIEV